MIIGTIMAVFMLVVARHYTSKKWMEPFTELLPCLFDHMHRSTPDLPVAHTIRELALCHDDNSTFLLTFVEMSQIIEYLCTI